MDGRDDIHLLSRPTRTLEEIITAPLQKSSALADAIARNSSSPTVLAGKANCEFECVLDSVVVGPTGRAELYKQFQLEASNSNSQSTLADKKKFEVRSLFSLLLEYPQNRFE